MKIKKIIIIIIFLLAIGGVVAYFITSKSKAPTYSTALVARGNLSQSVNETGTVKSADELDLSFSGSGKLKKINFKVGDNIKKDAVLAELDYSALVISQKEAQANLDSARESYKKLIAGAEYKDIAVSKAGLDQARNSYQSAKNEQDKTKKTAAENISQAEKNLKDLEQSNPGDITTYEQAIITAQTSLKNAKSTYQKSIDNNKQSALSTIDGKIPVADNALDIIDRTIKDDDAKDLISVKNIIYLNNTETAYDSSLSLLSQASDSLKSAKITYNIDDIEAALNLTLSLLNKTLETLQNCYSALENSITSSVFTQSDLDAFKTGISAQQTAVSTALNSVESAKHGLSDAELAYATNITNSEQALSQAQAAYDNAKNVAKNALSTAKISGDQQIVAAETRVSAALESMRIAEAQYNKTVSPSSKYDISLADAKIRQAQAAVDSISKQIENNIIKSPIEGTITKVNFKEGEQAMAGSPVFSILTQNNFEIEVLISEADIAKVIKDDKTEITLDAYGDEVKFTGQVTFIEPAETVIQDVIYYKVKVSFDPEGKTVKSGMTANVVIITAEKNDILTIPSRAVIDKTGQGKIARVLINGILEERQITIGLTGDEGIVEVLSGLKDGETVVTFIKENK
jgi:RND family efflux transporter MFP subunit